MTSAPIYGLNLLRGLQFLVESKTDWRTNATNELASHDHRTRGNAEIDYGDSKLSEFDDF